MSFGCRPSDVVGAGTFSIRFNVSAGGDSRQKMAWLSEGASVFHFGGESSVVEWGENDPETDTFGLYEAERRALSGHTPCFRRGGRLVEALKKGFGAQGRVRVRLCREPGWRVGAGVWRPQTASPAARLLHPSGRRSSGLCFSMVFGAVYPFCSVLCIRHCGLMEWRMHVGGRNFLVDQEHLRGASGSRLASVRQRSGS